MPGDVVLGRDGGVIFIPPHLAERIVETSEIVRLRDLFGQQRLREGVYTSGQIDTRWSDEIERDFSAWMEENVDELPVPASRIQELLESGHSDDETPKLTPILPQPCRRRPARGASARRFRPGPRSATAQRAAVRAARGARRRPVGGRRHPLDADGNIWAGASPGVMVVAPDGTQIGAIRLPEICANVAFGGARRNRLFMTASQSLYAVHVGVAGAHIC